MAEISAQPQVSAIIIVLNGEAYLAEAIDSIRAQSLRDWELLIVDDGSTDGTAAIARGYRDRDPGRIRLLSHPGNANLGMAASRNLGIVAARGRYVAFLDADDIWLPEKLAEQVAILEADPGLGLVYGRTLIWHSWDPRSARDDHYYDLGVAPDARYDPPVLFELLMENRAQSPTTCNAMMRAEVFEAVGRFDPQARGMFEDLSFFGKALATTPAYVSGRTWARYRQHEASCTALSASSGGDEWARLRALGRLARALDAREAPPSTPVRQALRGARQRAALDLAWAWLRPLRRVLRAVARRLPRMRPAR